jgi:TrmH family RNA methyltransferase
VKSVTSKDNPTFKALRLLATDAREQRRQVRTIIDGPHLLSAYLDRVGVPELVAVSESGASAPEIGALLASLGAVEVLQLRDSLFREISGTATPVGVLAVIAVPKPPPDEPTGSCVLLDAVQDAGNVGSILRSAAAAGIVDVFLGPGCAGAWTPRVLRAAQGAHFGLRIREQADLLSLIVNYRGISVAAVAHDAKSIYALDLSGDVAWLFGNEGAGLSAALTAAATARGTIPMAAGSESLNVAAAAAICLFEGVRQRLRTGKGNRA